MFLLRALTAFSVLNCSLGSCYHLIFNCRVNDLRSLNDRLTGLFELDICKKSISYAYAMDVIYLLEDLTGTLVVEHLF